MPAFAGADIWADPPIRTASAGLLTSRPFFRGACGGGAPVQGRRPRPLDDIAM
jgi:hypothetical protein